MTMHINLSPEMETFIKGKVATGFYGNATEVIRDAIRRMQAEEGRVTAWKAALKVGDFAEVKVTRTAAYDLWAEPACGSGGKGALRTAPMLGVRPGMRRVISRT